MEATNTFTTKLTEEEQFCSFIFYTLKRKTYYERKHGSDTIISKDFKKNGKDYILIAKFNSNGEYIMGFLTDGKGKNGINGKGVSVNRFLDLVKEEIA